MVNYAANIQAKKTCAYAYTAKRKPKIFIQIQYMQSSIDLNTKSKSHWPPQYVHQSNSQLFRLVS